MRGRPHRVDPLLTSIEDSMPGGVGYRVWFVAEFDDEAEHEAIRRAGSERVSVKPGSNYATKINLGYRLGFDGESYIFLGADDLHFHPGWLEAALDKFRDGIGVVGTNDLCNPDVLNGRHATHSLVSREYAMLGTIDEPGKILHEGYEHEWVDNEFCETAQSRGAFTVALDSVVEHLHPAVGKAPMDDLYAGMERRMRSGERVFNERRHLWTEDPGHQPKSASNSS